MGEREREMGERERERERGGKGWRKADGEARRGEERRGERERVKMNVGSGKSGGKERMEERR